MQDWARKLGIGSADGDRHRRRGRGQAADAGGAQRGLQDQHLQELALRRGRSASARARSPTGRGRWATTSTSRSARATCRPTRCRWRSRTRRSPTAATWSARTSACASTDPQGRTIQEIDPAAAQPRRHRPVLAHARSSTACTRRRPSRAAPPTRCSAATRSQIAGKTGTAQRPGQADQSWYIALAPYDDPKYVVAVTIEQGGFGVDSAAPAAQEILNALLHVNASKVHAPSSTAGAV